MTGGRIQRQSSKSVVTRYRAKLLTCTALANFATTALFATAFILLPVSSFADGGAGGAGGGGIAAGAGGTGSGGTGGAGSTGTGVDGGGGGGGGASDGTGGTGGDGGGGLGGGGGAVGAVGGAGAVGAVNLGGGGGGGGGGGASGASAASLPGGAPTGVVGGAGGAGATVTGVTVNTNAATIQGGTGGAGGAGGATTGTGGSGGAGGGGGTGVFFSAPGASLTNSGTIQGGAGGAAGALGAGTLGNGLAGASGTGGVGVVGSGLTIINSGTIAGGLASDTVTRANAITFTGGVNSLEIQSGSSISGNAVAVSGGTDTFALGGAADSAFDTTLLGTQYLNFAQFNKTGASTWTLTGTPGTTTPWTISAGTLKAGAVTNVFGATSAITVNTPGILDLAGFSQAIGSLAGSGTVTNSGGAGATLTEGGDNTSTLFSGVIQDGTSTTALTKTGSGKLTLSGTNTYSGATTINDGTLALTGGGSIANSSSVNLMNTTSIFDISGTTTGANIITLAGVAGSGVVLGTKTLTLSNASTTYSGVISGTNGALTLSAGTQTLAGDNTYTGLTTINGGTLQLGSGGTSGTVAGNVVNNGVLAINRSNALTLGGNISGTGAFQQDGTGTTVLSGTNTYNGATAINTGTLKGGATNALSASSAVTAAGGAFLDLGGFNQAIGSLAGSGTVTNSGGAGATLTEGGDNTSTLFSGVIQDGTSTTALTKTGSGKLTLSGTNIYTGATAINAGTLVVNGSIASSSLTTVNTGGALTGTGTVGNTSIVSDGRFQPGSGVAGSSMTVTGSLGFASGSTYVVDLNPTTSSFANVSGTATLGGATVNAIYASGDYVAKSYTILNSGSVSGTFGSVVNTNLPTDFKDSLSYDATHAYLNLSLSFTPASGGGLNINQQNVANAITNSFNTVGSIPIVFGAVTPSGLTQLSGEVGAGFSQGAFQAGTEFLNLMLNPSFDGHFATERFGPVGYADENQPAAAAKFDAFGRKQSPSIASRYRIWGSPYGGSGTVSGDSATGSHNTNSQTYAFASGLDYHLTSDTFVGFALAGGGTQWSLEQGLGSGRSDMFQAGVYGETHWGAAYLAGALAYSFHDVTTNRTVTVSGNDVLTANFKANVFSGRLEGGYRYGTPWLAVTPYAAVQIQSIALPDYGERAISGSSQFALNYASQNVTKTRTELGARFDKSYLLDQGETLTLHLGAAWVHDFGGSTRARAIFQTLSGSNFIVNGARPAADGGIVTVGAEYKLTNGWSVLAKLHGEFSKTTSLYSGFAMISKNLVSLVFNLLSPLSAL